MRACAASLAGASVIALIGAACSNDAGYIEIKKTGSKIQTLKGIAGEVAKIRQRQIPQPQPIQVKKR